MIVNSHVMIDTETLSTATNATLLTIGAVRFDPYQSTLEGSKEFYVKIDLDSCAGLDLHIDDSTIAWWGNQSQEAQEEAFSTEGRIHIADAFKELRKFCFGASHVWSNGSGFDLVICETIFKQLKIDPPWKFWQCRDCRTIVDLGINPARIETTAHNALMDAQEQARWIQVITNRLAELGLTPYKKS